MQSRFLAEKANDLVDKGDSYTAISGRIGSNSSMMGSANILQAQFTTSLGSYTFEYGFGATILGQNALYISVVDIG